MARSNVGHTAGMGASVGITGPSGTKVKPASRPARVRGGNVRSPSPNLSNTYGIRSQKANTRSAVTQGNGSTSNQAALTRKAKRQVG